MIKWDSNLKNTKIREYSTNYEELHARMAKKLNLNGLLITGYTIDSNNIRSLAT